MAGVPVAWGLDVGVSSLKAIKLRRDGDRVTVEAFDVIEHDKFLSEPDVDRDSLIRSTLQKFVSKYPVRRDVVYISVPGSMTFSRFVKLPPVETKKIPEIVRFEAIQQIPFPLDQVNWDYHTFQHPDSPDVEVGIFAMKKELVAQVMSNFRAAELNIQGVQLSSLAVYNAAAYDGMTEGKGTIVIDMGAENTNLVVLDSGRLWLRTINIGGNHFTDALAKSFKQPFARAEQLKKTAATSKYQKQIYQAMRPIFADLVAEIQRSIGNYNQTHRDSRLERVMGMGNPFKLPNLQKYLQQELKMDVERLENFRNANVEKAAAFSESILSMTTAYGLAVQALGLAQINANLLPVEIARQMMWKKKQPWFIGAAALVALGAVANAATLFMAKSDFNAAELSPEQDNEVLQSKFQNDVTAWNKVAFTYDQAQKQIDGQLQLLGKRKVWPLLVSDVFESLPQASRSASSPIVLTSMTADYVTSLSSTKTDGSSTTAQPGTPTPQAQQNAPASPPGTSNYGFLVTITGYVPREGNDGYRVVDGFMHDIRNRALQGKTDADRPYYYSDAAGESQYGGRGLDIASGGAGGGGGFAGGFAPVPTGAGASSGPTSTDRPWGNASGQFKDIFWPDLLNYHQAPPNSPTGIPGATPTPVAGQPMAMGELPYPVDLFTTRAGETPKLESMDKSYTFTLRYKVHVKVDETK